MTASLILASPDATFEGRVREALGARNGDVRCLGEEFLKLAPQAAASAVTAAGAEKPRVLALGPRVSRDIAARLVEEFDRAHPDIALVLIEPPSPGVLEWAMRAGIREVVDPDGPLQDLAEALRRARATAERRRAAMGKADDSRAGARHVITVISPKGGSGKTTTATNLAVGLAGARGPTVALVDLDLPFGDVANALRLLPQHTFSNAANALATLDTLSLKGLLTPHSSGVNSLCAPDSPAEAELVKPETVIRVIELLRAEFSHVILDTPAGLDENTLSALDLSTDIVLVCTMDVPSVRSLSKVVATLDRLGMTEATRHFVLNRADSKVGLEQAEVAASVGLPVDVAIPSSRALPLSMNQGAPVLQSDARSAPARQFQTLVQRFVPASTDNPMPLGIMRRRKSA